MTAIFLIYSNVHYHIQKSKLITNLLILLMDIYSLDTQYIDVRFYYNEEKTGIQSINLSGRKENGH